MITFVFDSVFTWCVAVLMTFLLCMYTNMSILLVHILVQSVDVIKVIIGYVLIKKGIWITNLVE